MEEHIFRHVVLKNKYWGSTKLAQHDCNPEYLNDRKENTETTTISFPPTKV